MAADLARRLNSFFVTWYRKHGRCFPWREPGVSPFHILLAEFLLRRTGAMRVAAVWPHFARRYPNARSLVDVPEGELSLDLKPLGLYRQRARALKELAQAIEERHGGAVPAEEQALLALPHVGQYIASAIRVFAYGQRDAVVDGSVARFLRRFTGLSLGTDPRRDPQLLIVARQIVPVEAREHAYGLLDFAATVCTPGKPKCRSCPLVYRSCVTCTPSRLLEEKSTRVGLRQTDHRGPSNICS